MFGIKFVFKKKSLSGKLLKILCCPDAFKDCMSASEAAYAMAKGIKELVPDAFVDVCPLADGGEGTVEAIVNSARGRFQKTTVRDPLGRELEAEWGTYATPKGERAAVIELAAASGIERLTADERNPMLTSSYGTGQLIAAALDQDITHLILGIGGSATNDGGCGAAQALGAKFYNHNDQLIETPIAGGMLRDIARIDLSELNPKLKDIDLAVACDVTNPMTGENGAAHTFGPQKGATDEQVQQLDEGLKHLAQLFRDQLDRDVEMREGAGAAGAFGGGAVALFNGRLQRGIDLVFKAIGFSQKLSGTHLVLTGEGKLDRSTWDGKTITGVIGKAHPMRIPIVALVGTIGPGAQMAWDRGLTSYEVIAGDLPPEESIRRAPELIGAAAARVVEQYLRDQRRK